MFTGLIQKVGRLADMTRRGGGARLIVEHDPWNGPVAEGESVAVHGICLTAAGAAGAGRLEFDVLRETLDRTNLGGKKHGSLLNLERAMGSSDRIGGHFVTGHIDGVGLVKELREDAGDRVLRIECGKEMIGMIAMKGSVSVDGVSLTVTELSGVLFAVRLAPFTWEHTAFGELGSGSSVNVETDILAKYVSRHFERSGRNEITAQRLKEAGF